MKKIYFVICCACVCSLTCQAQKGKTTSLFTADLSNAVYDKSVWSVDKEGVLTASADKCIWTKSEYENFELTLEFKNDICTNSGVIIYCSDINSWSPNSLEIQIADDYCTKWPDWPHNWRCGSVFGHLGPSKSYVVKKPGEWNKMKIVAKGKLVQVELNGQEIIDMDMNLWTTANSNPDGSAVPSWFVVPVAELQTKGLIGFQGKHGEAAIWFRKIEIKSIK